MPPALAPWLDNGDEMKVIHSCAVVCDLRDCRGGCGVEGAMAVCVYGSDSRGDGLARVPLYASGSLLCGSESGRNLCLLLWLPGCRAETK